MTDDIGRRIKTLRKGRHMTQLELADKIGITRSTISNYEVGRRTPHMKELRHIAEYFGVGLDYFGIASTDEVFDLLARAKEVFHSEDVPRDKKEELYKEFMRLYLDIK